MACQAASEQSGGSWTCLVFDAPSEPNQASSYLYGLNDSLEDWHGWNYVLCKVGLQETDYWASDYSYRDDIFTKIEYIQAATNLIDPDCAVYDDYGVQRSGRRCFTSECQDQEIDPQDIELQCRWSTDRASGHRQVQRTMLHTYSEVRNMKKALIRPSKLGM